MRNSVASGGHMLLFAALLGSSPSAIAADLDIPTPPPSPSSDEKAGRNAPVLPLRTELSGFVEVSRAGTTLRGDDANSKGRHWELRGTGNWGAGSDWNLQMDGTYQRASQAGAKANSFSVAGHGYFRQPDKYAVGVYAGMTRLSESSALPQLAAINLSQEAKIVSGGLETAYFLSQATVFARIGFGKILAEGPDLDQSALDAGARYYFTDNLRLDLEGGFQHRRTDHVKANVLSIGTTANYRLPNNPISAFGGYRFEGFSGKRNGAVFGGKTHGFLVGLRYHFGSESLKDEERTGPLWSSRHDGF